MPPSEKDELKKEGLVSPAIDTEPYTSLSETPRLRLPHEPTGVPLLDDAVMPDGRPNSHALEYVLVVNRFYKADARYLLEHERTAYIQSVFYGLGDWYCSSPTRDIVLGRSANLKHVEKIELKLEALLGRQRTGRLTALCMIAFPMCIAYAVYRLIRARSLRASERSTIVVLFFMVFTIVYAGLGTALISYGDFSRYRFDVDAFYMAISALMIEAAAQLATKATREGFAAVRRLAKRGVPTGRDFDAPIAIARDASEPTMPSHR